MVVRRGANFTAAELDGFLDIVEDTMPLSATHWENVAATHSARYPETGRNVGSLKRKFKELHNKRVSTGQSRWQCNTTTTTTTKMTTMTTMRTMTSDDGDDNGDDDGDDNNNNKDDIEDDDD